MEIFIFLVISFLVYRHINLSARVQKCEEALIALNKSNRDEKKQINQKIFLQRNDASLETSKKATIAEEIVEPTERVMQEPLKQKTLSKPFKIPNIIKENWMGVFGSVVLVTGAVFFGLTAEVMQHAEIRVGVMLAASFLLLGISQRLKSKSDWILLCGWLKSIAGAVILFATLGAGGIKGLQFIHTPIYALYFLCFGVSINILLAMTTPSQAMASFHVILSILAFCIVPQALILLPIGALVVSVGLGVAYQSKWDLHLLLIVIAFAIQNTIWTLSPDTQLFPWMHYLAIGSALVVSLIAACIHYSKKYQSPKLEVLPLAAHITNWGLLTWNIWLHAEFFKGTPLVLGIVAVAGFVLARVAQKKKIYWLYYTDTLLSQLVATAAIFSMSRFSINPLDLGLIVLFETLIFNFISRLQKEDFLLRAGYCLQYICCLVIINYTLETLSETPIADQFPIYLRMGVVTALSWGIHVIGSLQNYIVDDFRFVLFGQRDQKSPISITTLFGTVFLLGIYFFGFNSLGIQFVILSVIGLIALWRKLKEDYSWNIVFVFSLIFIHAMNWNHLVLLLEKGSIPLMISRVDCLGLILLDIFLIFGNFLQLKLWKRYIHNLVIYALGFQIGLLTYVFTKEVSLLIPGLVFLGFSVLTLEVGRIVPDLFKYSDDVKLKIKEAMTHMGLAFLIAFMVQFVTVHLQIDPIWHGISLRWATEAMGLLAIVYWIAFYPREGVSSKFTQFCGHRLVEGCLGFVSLCVFTEMPEVWRPFTWAIMAIGLLIGSLKARWPKRLSVYSWMYLMASIIHVVFVTSYLTMPNLFLIEQYNTPAFMAIALQICYAYIAHRVSGDLMKKENEMVAKGITKFFPTIYCRSNLTVILPVFLGLALFFAFNFEKTVLTFLWVGLTCLYLAIGLLVKSKESIQIAMVTLVFCSIRLILFDLVQTDLAIRALVFIGVGSLMLGVSVLYKKYKHRIDLHESV